MKAEPLQFPLIIRVTPEAAGGRLDQFLVPHTGDVGRSRVQEMISSGKILVNGKTAKPSLKLKGGEQVEVLEAADRKPLRAFAEDIALDVVYEDDDLAVVNKPAGMMVHAGAGATDSDRNRGTLVNALLHRFGAVAAGAAGSDESDEEVEGALSSVGGELRPGIVHRLDRETSGLILVAKTDSAHRKLAAQFAAREVKKQYVALVHGRMKLAKNTISTPIARDPGHRTRMTTRLREGREAVTHYSVLEEVETPYGVFSLLAVKIDTGRTHQIRVHLSSLGHPVVGDVLYGAPAELKPTAHPGHGPRVAVRATLGRNFLHAAALEFLHPTNGELLSFRAPLAIELETFVASLRTG